MIRGALNMALFVNILMRTTLLLLLVFSSNSKVVFAREATISLLWDANSAPKAIQYKDNNGWNRDPGPTSPWSKRIPPHGMDAKSIKLFRFDVSYDSNPVEIYFRLPAEKVADRFNISAPYVPCRERAIKRVLDAIKQSRNENFIRKNLLSILRLKATGCSRAKKLIVNAIVEAACLLSTREPTFVFAEDHRNYLRQINAQLTERFAGCDNTAKATFIQTVKIAKDNKLAQLLGGGDNRIKDAEAAFELISDLENLSRSKDWGGKPPGGQG